MFGNSLKTKIVYLIDNKLFCGAKIDDYELFLSNKSTKALAFKTCNSTSSTIAVYNRTLLLNFFEKGLNDRLCFENSEFIVNIKDNKNKDIEKLKLFSLAKESTTPIKFVKKHEKYQVICNHSLVNTNIFESKSDDKKPNYSSKSKANNKTLKYFTYFAICILSIIVGVYGKHLWVSVAYILKQFKL